MITQEELDLIHKYLENDLNTEEVILFKNYLASNNEFAKEVKRFTDIKIALKTASAARLKIEKKTKVVRLSWTKIAYAASVLIVISLGSYFIYNPSKPSSHQQLYAQYFENPFTENNEWTTRSGFSDNELKAINDLESAISQMEKENFNQAIIILESFNHQDHTFIMNDVEWYLALAYLHIGKPEKAKELLGIILNSNSKYSKKAWGLYENIVAY